MGWERRGNREYYYQAERVGGRVVKRYVGSGPVADLAAHLDAIERDKRETDRHLARLDRAAVEALDAPLAELTALADLVARAALTAAGFRQHHRGEWRRSRGRTDQAG